MAPWRFHCQSSKRRVGWRVSPLSGTLDTATESNIQPLVQTEASIWGDQTKKEIVFRLHDKHRRDEISRRTSGNLYGSKRGIWKYCLRESPLHSRILASNRSEVSQQDCFDLSASVERFVPRNSAEDGRCQRRYLLEMELPVPSESRSISNSVTRAPWYSERHACGNIPE